MFIAEILKNIAGRLVPSYHWKVSMGYRST